ncbi:hypothetical protein [Ktedonobacter racemifer]|uniref:hypothetical protein n=1 Tax=Ktedonobacter racemifer TaxID=363277 RepID=UPI001FCBE13E|nr:hypothetical protein [Ktedonobacter racemifer]
MALFATFLKCVRERERGEPLISPLARERQRVAFAYLLLAESQADQALNLLTPLVERATATQRWNHVLEMWLLQIQAYSMLQRQRRSISPGTGRAPGGARGLYPSLCGWGSHHQYIALPAQSTGAPGGRSPVSGDACARVQPATSGPANPSGKRASPKATPTVARPVKRA